MYELKTRFTLDFVTVRILVGEFSVYLTDRTAMLGALMSSILLYFVCSFVVVDQSFFMC